MATAAKNVDGSIAVVVFNEGPQEKYFDLSLEGETVTVKIDGQAIQTILLEAAKS
jgi:glucosylceramidase